MPHDSTRDPDFEYPTPMRMNGTTGANPVRREQRFTRNHTCPICGGYDSAARGRGVRCSGFLSDDGRYAHCSREEYAVSLEMKVGSSTYAHRLDGDCRCGVRHGTAPTPVSSSAPRSTTRRDTITYSYRDAEGVVAYEVGRREPKGFWQRHPDGTGGWINNMDGVERVLYNLPAILAAATDEQIFVVEGEKDADRLIGEGLIATTNVGGAGKWLPEYAETLRDRHIVILPDNDTPGQQHAGQVAGSLVSIAASIRVVELPDLPKKGDVSDWLDAGRTVVALLERVAETEGWTATGKPSSPTRARPGLVITSLADVTPREVAWLWPGWLARGKVAILGGHPGDGKSTITAALAAAHSWGGSWPDGTAAPIGKTLFLLAEDALDDTLRPRLDRHGADPTQIIAIEAVREADGSEHAFTLGNNLGLLEEAIREHEIDLIVIDPLTSFMPDSDRNSEGAVRDLLTPLTRLADETGAAIIGIMHVGKPNGTSRRPVQLLLGATAFGAVARTVWMVAPLSPDVREPGRLLAVVKSNLEMKPTPLEWEIDATSRAIIWHGPSDHDFGELLGGGKVQPRDRATEIVREALRDGAIPSTQLDELLDAAGVSKATARRANEAAGVETWKTRGVKDGQWMVGPPGSLKMLNDGHTKMSTFSSSPPEEAPAQRALTLPENAPPILRREGAQDAHRYIPDGERLQGDSIDGTATDDEGWGSLDDGA